MDLQRVVLVFKKKEQQQQKNNQSLIQSCEAFGLKLQKFLDGYKTLCIMVNTYCIVLPSLWDTVVYFLGSRRQVSTLLFTFGLSIEPLRAGSTLAHLFINHSPPASIHLSIHRLWKNTHTPWVLGSQSYV